MIAQFTAHPAPLPERSYWMWQQDGTWAVFSVGQQSVLVEQPVGPAAILEILQWLAEALPVLEWPQVTLALTCSTETVRHLAGPGPSLLPQKAPKLARRKPKPRPTVARFLKKRG